MQMSEEARHTKVDVLESDKLIDPNKTVINFDYVFCLGGDGTLLRMLRIFYFHTRPLSLPKIITVSMGSLCYLGNFKVEELA